MTQLDRPSLAIVDFKIFGHTITLAAKNAVNIYQKQWSIHECTFGRFCHHTSNTHADVGMGQDT